MRLSKPYWLLPTCLLALLYACAATPPEQPVLEITVAEMQAQIASEEAVDDRGRFREIFCEVLETNGEELPDYRSCDEALRTTGPEKGATGAPVPLGEAASEFLFLMVPGLGWDCFEAWLDPKFGGIKRVKSFGYDVRMIDVDGLSSSTHNARMINDYIAALPDEDADKPIVLGGYSKGTPDILVALADYPQMAERVVAVVSLAGAVKGSPLAMDATQDQANMLTMVPGSACEKESGDNEAVRSLVPEIRETWLRENILPAHVSYYSAVAFPEPERVSWILRNGYALLGKRDARNDTQLIVFDQILPGSKVFALLNADHWAVAVPIARGHPVAGKTMVDENDYPREAFLEALLRYLDEDLALSR